MLQQRAKTREQTGRISESPDPLDAVLEHRQEPPTHDVEFWFEDGTVVLRAGTVAFHRWVSRLPPIK
ncbi:uncharacterized protein B0H18DRAFT_52660 [Fomitopsis serialis]|uniref:uncharacterized protein n=1 Tax=Fomitopsis serialis TaxID=139415 RepID=UPI002007C575|nr:uncharacterized protein B0H18DRAFT_52660 [Neoantrodia serialis]KAH9932286.1 hypothetical protein B0H18DRAFT_52660 [Neoantrodia serialis]